MSAEHAQFCRRIARFESFTYQRHQHHQHTSANQVKLGRVPKNARLIEAMAQHKNAKPKPKGWLMAVVDSIYKEGGCSV